MFYIKKYTTYWVIEQRFKNGNIVYHTIPLPIGYRIDDRYVILQFAVGSLVTFQMLRTSVVLPQGESLESFLSNLFNPIPLPYTSTQIENLSNVVGSTVTDALNNLLAGGGGGVVESNIIAVNTNYTLLTTDYIAYATASGIGIRLPTIGLIIGMVYRIFANNNTINVLCDDPAGDRINGQISISLKKWDSATFRAIAPNKWLIGD